jgi:hypothetical protein
MDRLHNGNDTSAETHRRNNRRKRNTRIQRHKQHLISLHLALRKKSFHNPTSIFQLNVPPSYPAAKLKQQAGEHLNLTLNLQSAKTPYSKPQQQ